MDDGGKDCVLVNRTLNGRSTWAGQGIGVWDVADRSIRGPMVLRQEKMLKDRMSLVIYMDPSV